MARSRNRNAVLAVLALVLCSSVATVASAQRALLTAQAFADAAVDGNLEGTSKGYVAIGASAETSAGKSKGMTSAAGSSDSYFTPVGMGEGPKNGGKRGDSNARSHSDAVAMTDATQLVSDSKSNSKGIHARGPGFFRYTRPQVYTCKKNKTQEVLSAH